jgi:hypothetical protein
VAGGYAFVADWDSGLQIIDTEIVSMPSSGNSVGWICSSSDGIPDTSCSANKEACAIEGPYECILPDPGCLAPGACGTLEKVCWDYGSDILVPDSFCNTEADCGTYECSNPCSVPTAPVTPGGRSWRETHPEAN